MPKLFPKARLHRISLVTCADAKLWKEGVSLEKDSNFTIQVLLCRAAAARWNLAYSFRTQANKLISAASPQHRSAISRYYYSMYHAMRACVYLEHGGDDFEKHSDLPLHVPTTLDPTTNWSSKLKDARLLRNRADYDAYPVSNKAWSKSAASIKIDAGLLLKVSRQYLISKGCQL